MATSKKFSELPAASSLTNNDLVAIAHEDAQAETGFVSQKATSTQLASKVLGGIEFPTDLPTFPASGQNPFDALNYLKQKIEEIYPVETVSGAIANFTTSLALPLVACKAQIVAQQSGSGTPSPSNPRPIVGYDAVEITHEYGESDNDTYTISLPSTCYGGEIDVKNGSVKYNLVFVTFDGTEDWITNGANGVYLSIIGLGYLETANCNMYEPKPNGNSASMSDNQIRLNSSMTNILVKDPNHMTGASFQTFLQSNPLQVCFKVAETSFSVTAQEITPKQGVNNIFADSGDIEVSYKMGVQEYIDKKIAETQALIL